MKLAWATDIHLNFLDDGEMEAFLQSVCSADFDALAISGDIGESDSVVSFLEHLDEALERPIFFVLGNHDFYFGSISQTRQTIKSLVAARDRLCYLSQSQPIRLTSNTAIIGHDGWGDARAGSLAQTSLVISDFKVIEELKKWKSGPEYVEGLRLDQPVEQDLLKWKLRPEHLDREALEPVLNDLGDEAARHLASVLRVALEAFETVIAVTHVPPFLEACRCRGRLTDSDWLPFSCCKAVGDAMIEIMRSRPDKNLRVLCGHTHSGCSVKVLENLSVVCGEAEYMEPTIQGILDL